MDVHQLNFDGALLQRGYWLYVWRITHKVDEYCYVGRTGDSSSPHAASPFQRLSQHLGSNKKQNALLRHLGIRNVLAKNCNFAHLSIGPVFPELIFEDTFSHEQKMVEHKVLRDRIAALEYKLAGWLAGRGYNLLNAVKCRKILQESDWARVESDLCSFFPLVTCKSA